jgi:hypothetical protein
MWLNILICIHLLIFLNFFFIIVNDFFIYLHRYLSIYLIRCLHMFLYLHFDFFYVRNYIKPWYFLCKKRVSRFFKLVFKSLQIFISFSICNIHRLIWIISLFNVLKKKITNPSAYSLNPSAHPSFPFLFTLCEKLDFL